LKKKQRAILKINQMNLKNIKINTQTPSATKKIGQILAQEILVSLKKQNRALVFGLIGDLGSGKTTFIQGLASGLKIKNKILSPTFVIFKKYKFFDISKKVCWFYHFDCYRINNLNDLLVIGLSEILNQKNAVVFFEWADKIKKALPKNYLLINFLHQGGNCRQINIGKNNT
jgi:tRNA threonylcarbamoyladenosine biosynthesis protein TsaE